ncbi:cob(I)yrinic acid a c-diamide adenosyltransferase [Methyloceanibacter superfactus]|jgi:cob(I)alamin adenosyltransferase|uniref:Corrinoid adenosyltransferase n=1 Tax=Methyloceanibacter superfactus TaxID=1774969 RepID=A0A1E3VXT9_9HYPH|nr:cob(I)yrinic acid a,c-diamide adenosyltransferase [Methyloceanibacter superfactus]ODR98354.1 cob(I)yrinic acid a c-diamide adenosyltransferase [Methyloceanibacter superfactus]
MVILNKIYTRTGDDGTTALGSGRRVAKYDLRVESYGTLDETNAVIGLARIHTGTDDPELDAVLARIQNDLFDLGADLCFPDETKDGSARLQVTDAQVEWLEGKIDTLNRALDPLRSFVLPGGTPAASFLHLARTVSRRAERLIVALRSRPDEPVGDAALRYINRLSDFLFVAARYANGKGKSDVMWVPGKNR